MNKYIQSISFHYTYNPHFLVLRSHYITACAKKIFKYTFSEIKSTSYKIA